MPAPNSKERLALVIYGLGSGGTERVATLLANEWATAGCHVTIVTLQSADHIPFFDIHPNVHLQQLGTTKVRTSIFYALSANLMRIGRIRSALRQIAPDRVIAFADTVNIITILASLGLGIPVLISQRVSPTHHPLFWPWKLLRWALYRLASLVVTQTLGMSKEMPYASHTVVIPNPVLPAQELATAIDDSDTAPSIVTLGRLSAQKRHDMLINAFALVADQWPQWTLQIYGNGPKQDELSSLIASLNLEDRVTLRGNVKQTAPVLSRADIFVCSSDYEGFPNALCEAMAHAVPVISTDCPTGPSDIILDGENGFLVPPGDIMSLAAAMEKLIADTELRHKFGAAGKHSISRYAMPKILAHWEDAFRRTRRK